MLCTVLSQDLQRALDIMVAVLGTGQAGTQV